MRRTALLLAVLAAGCATPADPGPADAMLAFAARLRKAPEDGEALRGLVFELIGSDAEVMASMRRHHGTGDLMMRHYYPSHRWIHPFVRGCILAQQGKEEAAREEFRSAVEEASDYLARHGCFGGAVLSEVAEVVAQQARRRLAGPRE